MELSDVDRVALINAIAGREGNARAIAKRFGKTVAELRAFVEENREALELAREAIEASSQEDMRTVPPASLAELWISRKLDRLHRYEKIADYLYEDIMSGSTDPAVLREFRSYCNAAAQELGQLLHRGSGENGDGQRASYEFPGVDMGRLE